MKSRPITLPDELPLDLDDLKVHLRSTQHVEDELIVSFLAEAVDHLQQELGQTFLDTVWAEYFDRFQDPLCLQWAPTKTVDQIRYRDRAGDWQTLDQASYELDPTWQPGLVRPVYGESWPETLAYANVVEVHYTTGYGTTEKELPEGLKGLLRKYVGHLWMRREGTTETELKKLDLAFGREIMGHTMRALV